VEGVVLILGEERFLARQAIADALAARPELEATRFNADAAQPGRILDELRTPALLGGGRAVVVEEAGPLLDGEALGAFAAYARKPVPGTLLVLQAAKLDGRLKGAKALREAARTVVCDPPRTHEVAPWIGERARAAHGLQVGRDAAEALRRCVGEDLGLLDAALARLKEQVAPRRRLEASDVVASTEEHRSPVLFEASNALEAGDLEGALRAVRAAFEEGVRIRQSVVTEEAGIALILLGQLHGAWTKLLRFHMLRADGEPEAEAARAAGVSPQAARFFLERATRHRLDRLLARHRHFVEADLALKRGLEGPARALETLLLRLLA
jgi:DNA polymerase-3 subunit delta